MLHQHPKNEAANLVNMFDVGAFFTQQNTTPLDIFNQALNKFLFPHEISADECSIFMQTLIWLATNPEGSLTTTRDLYIKYDSHSTSVTITIRDISSSDFSKIYSFFRQAMPDQSGLSATHEVLAKSRLGKIIGTINGLSIAHLYALFNVFKQNFTKLNSEYLNFCRQMSRQNPTLLEYRQLKEIITLCSSAEDAAKDQLFLLGMITILNGQLISAIETYLDCLINQHALLQRAEDALTFQMNNFFMAQQKNDVLLENGNITAAAEKMMAYVKNKKAQKLMADYIMRLEQRIDTLASKANFSSLTATPSDSLSDLSSDSLSDLSSDSSSDSSLILSKSSESGLFGTTSNSPKSPAPVSKNDDVDATTSFSPTATGNTPH